jgi:hypothetical protein
MAIIIWERPRPKPPLLERFGKTFREAQKEILEQPLPERWLEQPLPERWEELVKQLDEQAGCERERGSGH